jgi:hypothetical protein
VAGTNKKYVKNSVAEVAAAPDIPRRRGRPRGSRNRVTLEARAAAALVVDDPVYRARLLKRAREGKLSPAMEVALWHYAKGRPKEVVEQATPCASYGTTVFDASASLAKPPRHCQTRGERTERCETRHGLFCGF